MTTYLFAARFRSLRTGGVTSGSILGDQRATLDTIRRRIATASSQALAVTPIRADWTSNWTTVGFNVIVAPQSDARRRLGEDALLGDRFPRDCRSDQIIRIQQAKTKDMTNRKSGAILDKVVRVQPGRPRGPHHQVLHVAPRQPRVGLQRQSGNAGAEGRRGRGARVRVGALETQISRVNASLGILARTVRRVFFWLR